MKEAASVIVSVCQGSVCLSVKSEQNPELNPFSKLFAGLDSDYLITLNIGGIWNVISLWVRRGMKDDPEEVKAAIKQYLARIGTI